MRYITILLITLLSFAYGKEITLTTYNAGLAHTYVPYASERLPYILNALKKDQSDVICLQEVWRGEDRDYLIENLKEIYPFHQFEKINQDYSSKRPACKIKNIFGKGKFVSCTQKKCKKKDGDDFTSCVIEECGESLNKLKNENRQCAKALMAQVGKSSIKAIWAVINPFKAASLFSYGGGNGLLVLSKTELQNKRILDMTDISTLNRRAALVSEVKDFGTLKCAHLAADLSLDAPYPGNFPTWAEENKAQILKLLSTDNLRSSNQDELIVMGDMNCGPSLPEYEISGELEDNCNLFDDKFTNNLKTLAPECTFCTSNKLTGALRSVMIDHIYSKNQLATKVEVIFKELIDLDGELTNLSDHYGVRASFVK